MTDEPKGGQFFGGAQPKSGKSLSERLGWSNPVLQMVSFVIFIVGVVALTNLDLGFSTLQSAELVVDEPALEDIKATQDFVFVQTDPAATERKRSEAAAAVPSIYDHNVDVREQTIEQVRSAFAQVRDPLERAEADLRKSLEVPSPDAGEPPRSTLTEKAIVEFRVRTADTMRDNFVLALKAVVPDVHYIALSESGFSRTAEEALVSLIDTLMQRRVVEDRKVLEVEGHGILLRRTRKGVVEQTSKVYDIDESYLSLADIKRELEILAPGRLRELSPKLGRSILGLASELIKPNTTHNPTETAQAREAAQAEVQDIGEQESLRRGQIIVRAGQLITARHILLVKEMEGDDDRRVARAQVLIGTLVVVLGLLLLFYSYGRKNISKFKPLPKDLILMGILILGQLGLVQGLSLAFDRLGEGWVTISPDMIRFAIPLAVGGMIVRLVNNSETAMVFSILTALLVSLGVEHLLPFGIFALATSLIGAHAVGKVSHRMHVLKAGLIVGLVNAAVALALVLFQGEAAVSALLAVALAGLVGGLAAGVLANAILPVVEWAFDYTTDVKLLELADLNHPAIKDLILKAPGSYHHSIVVGTLAKEACEAIGANPLLSRVGSYYHDIGKGKNPQYFAENQRGGVNPHDKLKPNMSTLIIKAHVKDGLELARQHKLPREIQDFIAMHHGTTLIAYFYHRAKSMEDPSIPEVDEKDYRYPGPKPQTRETAIVMLADGIEAASHAMPDPTPARLKGLVQQKINHLFADGQLDECNLTLKDLNAIAKAFIRVLNSLYYTRPQYPGQEKNSGARVAQKRKEHSQTGEFSRDKDGDITQTGERKRRSKKGNFAEHAHEEQALHEAPPFDAEGIEGEEAQQEIDPERFDPEDVDAEVDDSAQALTSPDESAPMAAGELPPMDFGRGTLGVRFTGPLPPIADILNAHAQKAEPISEAEPKGETPPQDGDPEVAQEPAQPTVEDHAPGTDDQPISGRDAVDDGDRPPAADNTTAPSLRRLGLS